jgi:hypothetical protein
VEAVSDGTGVAIFSSTPTVRQGVAETGRLWGQRSISSNAGAEARIEVEDDLAMTVRVVDSAGSAVGGVPVRLSRFAADLPPIDFAHGTTAADGVFVARHLQRWGHLLQTGHKSQSFAARLGATFDGGNGVLFDGAALPKEPVTLPLPPSARMTVSVVERDGRPFTGAAYAGVKVWEDPSEAAIRRAVEQNPNDWRFRTFWLPIVAGRATFPFVGLGSKLTVKVHALEREHALASSDFDGPSQPGQDLQITVEAGQRVPVVVARLVDEAQHPLRNCSVSICPQSKTTGTYWPWEVVSGTSDGNGKVRLPISGVPWRISTGLLGFKAWDRPFSGSTRTLLAVQHVDVPSSGGDVVAGDVTMRPVPVLLAGSVRNETGAPVAGADLIVDRRLSGSSSVDYPPGLQSRTSRDGTFAFHEPCEPGDLRLFVSAKGFVKLAPIPFARGQSELSVTLPRAATLEGSVILPEGVAARELQVVMTGDCVQPSPEGYGPAREHHEVKADGSFVIETLRPGTGTLVVAPWTRSRETPRAALARIEGIEVVAGVTRDPRAQSIDLRERICTRTLTVVTAEGVAIAGAEVSFLPLGQAFGTGEGFRETGVDGRTTLVTGVEPVRVTIAKEGWLERTLALSESATSVMLERGVTLEVVVTSEAALPISPENLRIDLQRHERRIGPDSPDALEQFWDRAYALVDSTGVATIKAPFTGGAKLKMIVNREGGTHDGGVLPIDIKAAPERQRIEWRIPPDVLRKR